MKLTKAEIKYARSLSQKKFRDEEEKFLLEGWKPLADALDAGVDFEYIAVTEEAMEDPERSRVLSLARSKNVRLCEVSALELRQVTETMQSQGMFAVVQQRNCTLAELLKSKPPLIIACDELNDPGNLGAIIRVCDWFGVQALLLSTGSVSLYNDKVVRATAGSIFHVNVVEESDLEADVAFLKSRGYKVVVTAMDGTVPPKDLRKLEKMVLVLGSEARGVRTEIRVLADVVSTIPRFGNAESLNVAVACGAYLSSLRQI